ncbi:MAG: nitroreductase family protein, partial [Thaumarchaeota archaeon]|nr:nitroreductase family protein [Nitrososphaerota archaeon]
MDTFEAIESRRAIKSFDPNYTIPKQEIDKILSAA